MITLLIALNGTEWICVFHKRFSNGQQNTGGTRRGDLSGTVHTCLHMQLLSRACDPVCPSVRKAHMHCLFPWSGDILAICLQIKIILLLKLPTCYLWRRQGFFSKKGPTNLPQIWANRWSGQRLGDFHLLEKLIHRASAEFPFQCNLSPSDKGSRVLWTLYYITLMWSGPLFIVFHCVGLGTGLHGCSFLLLQPSRGD